MTLRILTVIFFFWTIPLQALAQQGHWEEIPYERYRSSIIYWSKVEDKLYISGPVAGKKNGVIYNVLILDKNGNEDTLLLEPPMDFFLGGTHFINYKNNLYAYSYGKNLFMKDEVGIWKPKFPGKGGFHFQNVVNNKLYLGAFCKDTIGIGINGLAVFDGNQWEAYHPWKNLQDSINSSPAVFAFAEYKGKSYIGGNFYNPRTFELRDLMVWDGKSWSWLGENLKFNSLSTVDGMLVWKNELYIYGQFNKQQGGLGNGIVRWDGHRWLSMGNGLTTFDYEVGVYDVVEYRNELIVAGTFMHADGMPSRGLARWTGERWCMFATIDGQIHEMEVYNGDLYVSGGFWSINGDSTFKDLARWSGPLPNTECGKVVENVHDNVLVAYPNPVGDVLYINKQGAKQALVFSADGKLVANANEQQIPNGIKADHWAPGIYFLKLRSDNEKEEVVKVIKL